MNKYQKEINKLTKHYIKNKRQFHSKFKYFYGKQCGKTLLQTQNIIKHLQETQYLNSNRYYRYIRKRIRRDMATSLNLPSQKFKMEYDCKWISNK